jgi:hypothetical protein
VGELLTFGLKVLLGWLRYRFSPLYELKKIRHATEVERVAISTALDTGDTAALSRIWRELSA